MIKIILLAAGLSKRMKSENKLIKLYKNKPLINYSLNVLKKSKANKIIIVLGHQYKEVKKIIKKNKKIIFTYNKNYKKGMASSIKMGLKKVSKNDDGFIVAQSDMPFVKQSDINKICRSIKTKKFLVHALKYKNRLGNPIGFDISLIKKFKNIKGQFGAKFMVKRLKNRTNFINISSLKSFKDFDKVSDFRS
ncbi:nucleotidyltransferase family protein [Candidatus Pelagibacter sp. FZCC0015]|uniref:nucleotidyltransferase family protein n=1 Tax=Candidatus Pelagibacter sp. FZCC0015 TaxID=2268451 RepID=UPI00119FFE63|nr:nucleotidyltransferase family protein [Candidatus Pelagibacter sp. FZCC0015]